MSSEPAMTIHIARKMLVNLIDMQKVETRRRLRNSLLDVEAAQRARDRPGIGPELATRYTRSVRSCRAAATRHQHKLDALLALEKEISVVFDFAYANGAGTR